MDEVIEMQGCAPGYTLEQSGSDWWCHMDNPGSPPGDGGGGGGGGGEDGGGGGGDPYGDWNGIDPAEVERIWNCGRCKASADKCQNDARVAESLCISNSARMAQWRCDPDARGTNLTLTAHGCSIWEHWNEKCPAGGGSGVNWEYSCKTPFKTLPKGCFGPGINNCRSSWATSHPGGSTSVTETGSFTANFGGGFGVTETTAVTSTFTMTPRMGYVVSCERMGTGLLMGCTNAQQACYAQYSCTPADLGEL